MSYHVRDCIGTPRQAHGVTSEAEYIEHARKFLLRHGMPPSLVKESSLALPAYVTGGWWVVKCPCGNAPAVHPGDGTDVWPRAIAICLECGAIYRPTLPSDWRAAEAALLERPEPGNRHYFPHKDCAAWVGEDRAQTVAYLKKENARELQPKVASRSGEPA